jgi:pyridoxamine 5'-phosphate oxidase
MDMDEIRRASLELMERAETAVMTNIGPDGYPHSRAIFNLRNKTQYPMLTHLFEGHNEDMMVYFGTNTSSRKVAELRDDPHVSVYYCIPGQFHGMMLAGDIEILDDLEIARALWVDGWERYYPQGPDDPDFTVLRLYPKYGRGWYRADHFELCFAERSRQ